MTDDMKQTKLKMVARVQLGLIGMVNDAEITEREKRIQPDESMLLLNDSQEGSILKPADAGLEFRASPNFHLRRSK